MFTIKSYPQVPYPHAFSTLPGMVNPRFSGGVGSTRLMVGLDLRVFSNLNSSMFQFKYTFQRERR